MDDKPHIGLVNTHTEGDGRHDNIDILAQEGILVCTAHRALHAGMIGQRLDVVETEHLGEFLHLFAAQTIDDARLSLVGLDELDDFTIHVFALGPHLVVEVGAVER